MAAQRLSPSDGDFFRAGCNCRLHSAHQDNDSTFAAICFARTAQGSAGVVSGRVVVVARTRIWLRLLLCFVLSATFSSILPEEKVPHGFQLGAISFAAGLVCVCILSYQRQLPGHPLLPLSITNIVIAIFVLRWVLPRLHGAERILEVVYFGIVDRYEYLRLDLHRSGALGKFVVVHV